MGLSVVIHLAHRTSPSAIGATRAPLSLAVPTTGLAPARQCFVGQGLPHRHCASDFIISDGHGVEFAWDHGPDEAHDVKVCFFGELEQRNGTDCPVARVVAEPVEDAHGRLGLTQV